MGTTLTIRNLAEPVKRKLRMQAARHGHSMEAEARELLAAALERPNITPADREAEVAQRRKRIERVIGIWEDRYEGKSTDEIMKELRGDD